MNLFSGQNKLLLHPGDWPTTLCQSPLLVAYPQFRPCETITMIVGIEIVIATIEDFYLCEKITVLQWRIIETVARITREKRIIGKSQRETIIIAVGGS